MRKWIIAVLSFLSFGYSQAQAPKREFRGLWVTTAHNLDWPSRWDLSPEQQREEFIHILDRAKENGLNAIIVQVRAQSDAFYKSSFEPWSQWLNEKPGKAPEPYYDPLEFMVKECKKRNMEIHAWFNLFRGVSHTKFSLINEEHITKKKPEWFYEFGKSLFMDPGIPEAKNYLIRVILDVVDRYDIDGIHLDDYFYPIESKRDKRKQIKDQETFEKHKGNFKSIEDWRRYNINIIIKQLNDSIKAHKPWVKFGVSPFPVWRNKWDDPEGSETNRTSGTFDHYYADTRKWIKYGWVDYLAPQMYWGTKFDRVNYNKITSWWSDHSYDRHIYIGHAFYKLTDTTGEASSDPSWSNPLEINEQIAYARQLGNIMGGAFFRAASFNDRSRRYEKMIRDSLYTNIALIPTMPWIDSIPPLAPGNAQFYKPKENDTEAILKWDESKVASDDQLAAYYGIYRIPLDSSLCLTSSNLFRVVRNNYLHIQEANYKGYYFIVTAFDRCHNESTSFIGAFPP